MTTCLGYINDILETEPRFFKNNFIQLFQTMQKICSSKGLDNKEEISEIAITILLTFAERSPKIFKNQQGYIKDLLQIIFTFMVEATEEASPEWMSPPEGIYIMRVTSK